MDLELQRPDPLDDESWAAIVQYRDRLATAIELDDAPLVIGSAKELVESVGRVVLASAAVVLPSNAEYNEVVNAAHVALGRQGGKGLTSAKDAVGIAEMAKKLVLKIRGLRNDFGTGHGRGETRSIPDEMISLVVSGALLWVRWALIRLGHVLLQAPERLIAELRGSIVTQASLQEHLDALGLSDQLPDVQHALGVAFGQRAASGTFVANRVGVRPATGEDLAAWPPAYRMGVVEGLALSSEGFLALEESWIQTMIDVLAPLPPRQIKDFLSSLGEKVAEAGTAPARSVEEDYNLARAMDQHIRQVPEEAHAEWQRLAEMIDPITEEEEPGTR